MRVTAAGRAALASSNHVGANRITITRVLVGSGQGPGGAADDARTTLRNQRDAAAAGGSTTVPARIHVRGDVQPTADYNITEVGLEARIGDDGAPFLFAYWSAAGEIYAAAVTGVTVVIVAAIDVASDTPAAVTISGDPAVTVAYPAAWTALTDTPAAIVAGGLCRGNAAASALEMATPAAVLSTMLAGIAPGRYLRVRDTGGGVLGLEARTPAQIAAEMFVHWQLAADYRPPAGASHVVATVTGIPRGWDCVGTIAAAEYRQENRWLSAAGVELARVTCPRLSATDGGNLYWVPLGFRFTAPGGTLTLRQNGLGSTRAAGRTWMRASVA